MALALLLFAPGAGARQSDSRTEFTDLLCGAEEGADTAALGRAAQELARLPGAVAGYLFVAATGTLPGEAGADPRPLTPGQWRLLRSTAPELAPAEVAAHVRQALRGDPDHSWRLAALELMARHATAADLGLLIDLVPEPAADREALLPGFRAAWVELSRRDPGIYSELDATGFVPAAVAVEMVRAAGIVGHPRGATWLAEQLDDSDLVDAALQEIGRLARDISPERAPALAAAVRPFLESEEPSRRGHAMRALAALRDADAVPRLIEMLDLAAAGERQRLLGALRELSGCNLPDRTDAWREWHRAEQRWWEEQAEAALERLSSDDVHAVIAAIREVSERTLRRDQLALRLPELLRHAAPEVRQQACAGLARLRSSAALGDLVQALDDPEPTVREAALRALRSITGLSLPLDRGAWSRALLSDGRREP